MRCWKQCDDYGDRRSSTLRDKRAAFALLASVALHDKVAPESAFLEAFPFIEGAADDQRNFVMKAANWALRAMNMRNRALNSAATKVARRLAEAVDQTPRWIGKDALRDLTKPALLKKLASRAS